MVSNAFSRRRHVIKAPSVCHKTWPEIPIVPPYDPCVCHLTLEWIPTPHYFNLSTSANSPSAPPGSDVLVWIHSKPELAYANPFHVPNGSATFLAHVDVPTGTTSVTVNAGYMFTAGHRCADHKTIATPGA